MSRVAVIKFPGTNCESETRRAAIAAGMDADIFRWNGPYEELGGYDGYIIPGGFSYNDWGRAGIVAALDPVMDIVRDGAHYGKPVLGICNGAQILNEGMLVPAEGKLGMALARNKRMSNGEVLGTGYYNDWVYVKSSSNRKRTAFTQTMDEGYVFQVPVAHAEGRFMTRERGLPERLMKNGQIVFRYCTREGGIAEDCSVNPNGSLLNIAGICNSRGNVLVMMPHPERCAFRYQVLNKGFGYDPLEHGPGMEIFKSMGMYIENNYTLGFEERMPEPVRLEPGKGEAVKGEYQIEFFVDLIINDDEATTIKNAIQRAGFGQLEKLRRQDYWSIALGCRPESFEDLAGELIRSGELLNTNKEEALVFFPGQRVMRYDKDRCGFSPDRPEGIGEGLYEFGILVHDTEDFRGMEKTANLRNRWGFRNILDAKYGRCWTLGIRAGNKREAEGIFKGIRETQIFENPHYQEYILV